MKGMRYYLSSYLPTIPSPIPCCGYLTPHRLVGNARESGDVMVSATRIDTDLTTIEHLDFDPAIPCECSPDDDPCDETAELILEDSPCVACGVDDGRWLCSIACWDAMATDEDGMWVICVCGAYFDRDETLRIIGRLS